MQRRVLELHTYRDVRAELERLETVPYTQLGRWSLAQICAHCAHLMRGSLDGFHLRIPWVIRATVGRFLRRKVLRGGRMKAGLPTLEPWRPAPADDNPLLVADARDLLLRLERHAGPLHPSPLFGPLSPAEWERLHTVHWAHHLSFLVPAVPSMPSPT